MNNTTKGLESKAQKYAFVEFIHSSNTICVIGQVGTIKPAVIDCPCIQSKHQGVFHSKYGTLLSTHNGGIGCELKICVNYKPFEVPFAHPFHFVLYICINLLSMFDICLSHFIIQPSSNGLYFPLSFGILGQ